MIDKIEEYTDLFFFEILGRIPLVGGRISEWRSERNWRR